MTVQENLEVFIERVKKSKEALVEAYPTEPDSPLTIEIRRRNKTVGTMVAEPNENILQMLLKFSITGMGADEIWLAMETYHSDLLISPGTGKPWADNEMNEALETRPDWLSPGMIHEAIAVYAWARTGEMAEDMLLFDLDGPKVNWGQRLGHGLEHSNFVEVVSTMWLDTTMAEDAMSATEGNRPDLPPMPQVLKDQLKVMPLEEREARIDLVVASFLRAVASHLGVMAVVSLDAKEGSIRNKVLTERAPGIGAIHLKPGEDLNDKW